MHTRVVVERLRQDEAKQSAISGLKTTAEVCVMHRLAYIICIIVTTAIKSCKIVHCNHLDN